VNVLVGEGMKVGVVDGVRVGRGFEVDVGRGELDGVRVTGGISLLSVGDAGGRLAEIGEFTQAVRARLIKTRVTKNFIIIIGCLIIMGLEDVSNWCERYSGVGRSI
jgi:hypothetical protein